MAYSAILHVSGQDYSVNTSGPVSGLPGYFVFFNSGEVRGSFGVMAPAMGKPVPVTAQDLTQHSVDIYNNGTLVQSLSISQVQWQGGWEFKLSPDIIHVTPAQLKASGAVPPYFIIDVVPYRNGPPKAGDPEYAPGGAYGMTRAMGTTGERGDIGVITDRQADALLHDADAASLSNLFLEAAGFYSMPIWGYAPDGKPWNMLATPYACTNPAAGQQFLVSSSPATSPIPTTSRWHMDGGHNPRWPYVAYMMTQETRYLRVGQFYTSSLIMGDNSWSRKAGYPIFGQGQDRGAAWVLADLLCVVMATKAEEVKCAAQGIPFPADLHSYAYWKQLLDNQLKWFTSAYMNDPGCQRYGIFPVQGYISPWQQDHFNNVVFWAARNFPEWAPIATFLARNVLGRTSGKSGWPPCHPCPYRLGFGPAYTKDASWGAGNPGTIVDAMLYQGGWAEVWAEYAKIGLTSPNGVANMKPAQIQQISGDPFGGGNWIGWDKASEHFTLEGLAMLVDLQRRGIVNIDAAYPGEDLEATYALQRKYAIKRNAMSPRWCIGVTPSGVVIPPQPPTGGIHMGKPINLTPGQTVHIPLTYDDGHGGPSQPPVSISWSATPSGVVTLSNGNISGVDVTAGTTMGSFVLGADDGKGHTDSAPGTVALPLVGAIHVNP